MTHEPDQEHTPIDQEVLTGPGGAEPKRSALHERWRGQSVRTRAVIAATTVAVLAAGGTVAYAATSTGSSGEAGTSASASGSASPDDREHRHGRGPWSGLGGGGVHGEATVKDLDGDWVVRVWQRGTVEKVDGDQVTVKSEDGAEWTWTVEDDTTVLGDDSSDSGTDALDDGETVYVTGTRSDDDTRNAAQVITGDWEKDWHRGPAERGLPG
ncbi:hypothetical protein [Streptomyces fulvoviolaceus]|uniref:hypothetical protein n=1 Tax=Streptomyces fulvoviolaceus TaxID=285535 RepID=UPI000693C519|nr:hypothetical protein [Streptomyces fulvoviolaceus]MCT9082676.1 hypothetical protein [Streptomyces fulvoviolaceus]